MVYPYMRQQASNKDIDVAYVFTWKVFKIKGQKSGYKSVYFYTRVYTYLNVYK